MVGLAATVYATIPLAVPELVVVTQLTPLDALQLQPGLAVTPMLPEPPECVSDALVDDRA